jgi:hypothetical protein
MMASSPPPMASHLSVLPEELQQHVLDWCEGSLELGRVASVCRLWRSMQPEAAAAVLARRRGADVPASPCPLRSLHAWEDLVSIVGPPNAGSSWRSEYQSLDLEQDMIHGAAPLHPLMLWVYHEGQPCSISARVRLSHHAKAIAWCVEAGWDEEDAQAYTIIFNYGRGALCTALGARTSKFAASAHAVDRALHCASVRSAPTVAPECYVNLYGAWGLCEVDFAWTTLDSLDDDLDQIAKDSATDHQRITADRQRITSEWLGTSFRTWGVAGAERADSNSFPTDEEGRCRGIHVPLTYETHTAWERQEGPVVRFLSRPAVPNGAMRSLTQTSETAFDAPPRALVTLERVDEAGTWEVLDGIRPECRLFTVSVEYG